MIIDHFRIKVLNGRQNEEGPDVRQWLTEGWFCFSPKIWGFLRF